METRTGNLITDPYSPTLSPTKNHDLFNNIGQVLGLRQQNTYRVVKLMPMEIQTGTLLSRLRAGVNWIMSATLRAA